MSKNIFNVWKNQKIRRWYIEKNKSKMQVSPIYGEEYTLRANVDDAKKQKMYDELENKMGFVD